MLSHMSLLMFCVCSVSLHPTSAAPSILENKVFHLPQVSPITFLFTTCVTYYLFIYHMCHQLPFYLPQVSPITFLFTTCVTNYLFIYHRRNRLPFYLQQLCHRLTFYLPQVCHRLPFSVIKHQLLSHGARLFHFHVDYLRKSFYSRSFM